MIPEKTAKGVPKNIIFRDDYLSLLVQSPVKQKHFVREIKGAEADYFY